MTRHLPPGEHQGRQRPVIYRGCPQPGCSRLVPVGVMACPDCAKKHSK
jgi:hypothetical protein